MAPHLKLFCNNRGILLWICNSFLRTRSVAEVACTPWQEKHLATQLVSQWTEASPVYRRSHNDTRRLPRWNKDGYPRRKLQAWMAGAFLQVMKGIIFWHFAAVNTKTRATGKVCKLISSICNKRHLATSAQPEAKCRQPMGRQMCMYSRLLVSWRASTTKYKVSMDMHGTWIWR